MQGTIGDIGHASGPLLAGILIANLNYANAFAIIAGLQLVAAAIFWMAMRRARRPPYNRLVLVLHAIATENVVIGTLAGIGVVVLIVMVVFVVKRIIKGE